MDQNVHEPIAHANGASAANGIVPQHLIHHTQHPQYQQYQQYNHQQQQHQHQQMLHQQQQHQLQASNLSMFPRHAQGSFPHQSRQGLPRFTASGGTSGHQTPIHSSTPIMAMGNAAGAGSGSQNSSNAGSAQGFAPARFSRTPSPSPNRSRAHSPPGLSHPANSSFSSGRLSPASLFQGTQPLSETGVQDKGKGTYSARSNCNNNVLGIEGSFSSISNIQFQPHPNFSQSTPNHHSSNASPSNEFFGHGDGHHPNQSAINTPQSSSSRWSSFSHQQHQPQQQQHHQMQYQSQHQHFDQTPLSIPQTLFLEQMDSPHPPGFGPPGAGAGGNRDSHYGSFASSPAIPFHQQHQQRVGRPLSTQNSPLGPVVVAPLPSRQRAQLHGQSQSIPGSSYTPTFNPQHHSTQQGGEVSLQGTPTGVRSHPAFAPPPPPPSIKRQDSDESQSGVLKVPVGYFPIFNGSEWVLISHTAANIAGIPIPVPQNSPSHNNMMDGQLGSMSRANSPPAYSSLRRQASEIGQGAKQGGTAMRRTDSESRRGSLPSSVSRTGSPTDFKSSKSPGSPNFHNNESSSAVQENLDFLDLLQRYEYLSAWARQGKSKTPSETGSPVDGGVQKRQEPFEKSLVLKEITEWIEDHKDYLLREKQDLFLPAHIDFGNINPNADKTIKTLRIENHGPRIVQLRPLQIIPNAYDQLGTPFKDTVIVYPANGTEPMFANIDISLKTGPNLGFFSSWLLILVNDSSLIGRKITWNVTNNTSIDREMDPFAKSYTPQWLRNLNTVKPRMVITGEQASTIDFAAYLEANDHPCYKKHNGKFSLEPPKVESMEVILPGQVSIDLSADSYASRFHPLLRVEQYLVNDDVSTYNLFMVDLKLADAASNYFQFQVNGLSEQCPMLLRGDAVTVRQVTNGIFSGIEYKTFVHGTNNRNNSVYVHLPMGALPSLAQERWNIQFKISNSRIKEMYRAVGGIQEFLGYHPRDPAQDAGEDGEVDTFYSARSFLFPTLQDTRPKTKLPSINLGFVDASLNWEQKSAVQSIVRNDYGPIPFIISGPPGTGKTKTLAETALQVLMNDTQCHVLITAPSNSACDTLISRLIPFLGTQYLFRLNHPSRTFAEVPTVIMPYCYGEMHFDLPPLDELLQFRIVVCTCVDAGLLISAGASNQSLREYLPHKGFTSDDEPLRSHWTHLLIDEAGQAIEPETDIPLLCVLDECEDPPQIVLCGDHNQLGPKTFLPELQLSFLERLATTIPVYCDHPQSRKFARGKTFQPGTAVANNPMDTALLEKTIPAFANLVQNYRSHPKMLMMPSAMFYNNTLVASGEKRVVNSMLGCEVLPNPECPIVFVGVGGIDTSHLGEAVSWRNEMEADKVADTIQRLLHSESNENGTSDLNVKVSDIGVIAPFREQVKHLRQVLRAKGFSGVNVGTVEDYQGQEYRIVLISTTRSRVKYLDQDVRQGLGLVHFKKRFNVALTRAQAMMVIVGNPELLVLDECWADYLHFCLRNGAYTGCPLPDSILNTHTGNRENSTLIGRLEMNCIVSQFVDNLDRGRWLGGRTEIEEEGFIVVPTSSDSENGEDQENDEDENDDDYQEDEQDEDAGLFDPDMSFRSERNGHVLGLNDQDEVGSHIYGGGVGVGHRSGHNSTMIGEQGDDEDESARSAMEKLALGSLNMDDDTPVLSYSAVNNKVIQDHRGPGHQSTASAINPSNNHVNNGTSISSSLAGVGTNSANTGASWSYRQHQKASLESQAAHMVPSPNLWPANTREFKRMSASKLVLERSFDPTEQDLLEDY